MSISILLMKGRHKFMLNQFRKDCYSYASLLGDFQNMSVDDLANGYCKAIDEEDDSNQNKYLSALVLRFWYTIGKLATASKGLGLDREEFASWLVEAINYACKYRAWQDPKKHTNAQAAINQCISTIRSQHYYQYNLQKNRANFNNVSLDTPLVGDTESGHILTLEDTLDVGSEEDEKSALNAKSLVQSFVNNKKIIDAIIIDTIAFEDVEKHTKKTVEGTDADGNPTKYVQTSSQFWPYKLVQALGNLPDNYKLYFSKKYDVVAAELDASINAIRRANNQKLYKYLDSCLISLKQAYLSQK